jgi:hypothetical protein
LTTNFKAIFDLTDTSWIPGTDPVLVKELLLVSFKKLLHFTKSNQSSKEFEKFLEVTNVFDDVAINQVKKHFSPLMEAYFKSVSERKIKQKYINEL